MYYSAPAKDEAVWQLNCGRGVHHHCSWPPLLLQLRLLTKWTQGPKLLLACAVEDAKESSSPAVQQQAGSRPAVIKTVACSGAGSSSQGQVNLRLFSQACECQLPILTRPTDSCLDYVEQELAACKALAWPSLRRMMPASHAHYGSPWLLWALLLALLSSQGATALVGVATVVTRSFNQAVPGQCDRVECLSNQADQARVNSQQIFQDFLDCTGLSSEPLEYYSMPLHVWVTRLLPEDAVQQLSQDPAKACIQVLFQNGTWPLPATFLETVAAGPGLPPAVQQSRRLRLPRCQQFQAVSPALALLVPRRSAAMRDGAA